MQLGRVAEQLVLQQTGQGLAPTLWRQARQGGLVPGEHASGYHQDQFLRRRPTTGRAFESLGVGGAHAVQPGPLVNHPGSPQLARVGRRADKEKAHTSGGLDGWKTRDCRQQ
jgi:hypothetical protein